MSAEYLGLSSPGHCDLLFEDVNTELPPGFILTFPCPGRPRNDDTGNFVVQGNIEPYRDWTDGDSDVRYPHTVGCIEGNVTCRVDVRVGFVSDRWGQIYGFKSRMSWWISRIYSVVI